MKKFFKTLGWCLSIPFVAMALFFNVMKIRRKLRKYRKDPASVPLQDRLKWIYKLFNKYLWLKRIKLEAIDVEKLPVKQMLIIADHKSNYDPLVIFKSLYENNKLGPISFVCKFELSEKWYTRCVIQLMDGIFLKRDSGRSIYECYLKETNNIKNGFSIAVFPEGTRVIGDTFLEFKPATLKVAFENFIPIAPICIFGADRKRKKFNPLNVKLVALKPRQPATFVNIKQEQLMQTLQDEIITKYNDLKAKDTEHLPPVEKKK